MQPVGAELPRRRQPALSGPPRLPIPAGGSARRIPDREWYGRECPDPRRQSIAGPRRLRRIVTMKLYRRESERGQTLVEFGLIIPIVLLIMVGLFDLGRIVFINNSLSDGARNGARSASTRPRDTDYCARVDDAVRSAVRGQPLTPYTVTFTTLDGAGNTLSTYLVCQDGANGPGRAAMIADQQ